MIKTILESFDIWTRSQTIKSNGRTAGVDNQRLLGIDKLRELILELAVRGKLVPQDEKDEPAINLIYKIEKVKEQQLKEGKNRKTEVLPKILENPFDLPKGWLFVRLGTIVTKIGSGSTPKEGYVKPSDGIIFLRSQNIRNYGIDLEDVVYISSETHKKMSGTRVLPNDILLNITGGSLGRSTIFNEKNSEANVSQHVTIIRPAINELRKYLHLCILSPYLQGLIWGRQVGMAREGLSKKVLECFEIPIPPLAEQHRIIAKVDELMALCDQLEQQQTESNTTHHQLVELLLQNLTEASGPEAFATAWQRIATNFDTLFTTEYSIDQLKQTILQLAVMGKLVPQDPKDEPASELLKKIAKEKERLVKEGKIKKQEKLPEIAEDEKPFELPVTWIWSRLGEVTNYGILEKVEPGQVDDSCWILELEDVEKESSNLLQRITVLERKFQSSKNKFYKGDVIYGKLRPYLDKVIIADESGICTTEMIPIRGFYGITPEYLRIVLKTQYFIRYATESTHGMNLPRLGTDKARMGLIPITSISEQHRIVAKVDELFALCDALKERIKEAQETQGKLAEGVVDLQLK